MPTLKQSSAVNMAGWQPVAPRAASSQPAKTAPTDPSTRRNPQMLAAMPLMASTNDALTRQFYGGQNVPTFRILPVGVKQ
jgi:hypothetical protein